MIYLIVKNAKLIIVINVMELLKMILVYHVIILLFQFMKIKKLENVFLKMKKKI